MSSDDSVSAWIQLLQEGDSDAAEKIWSRYVEQLSRIARRSLQQRRVADEDDVVNCAFEALLRGVASGRFQQLSNRNDLWQILVMLTERRAIDQLRAEQAEKRGGGKVRGDSAFGLSSHHAGADQLPSPEPSAAFEAELSERVRERYAQLQSESLERVARARLEGYSNQEIARQLGVSVSSVERKLRLIREIWSEEDHADGSSDCPPARD